eukprot:CAMPEP_0172046354 /NCGR_PEP_ID=MMETSP1043-20130122/380_1 /TAXON_ID=464988 /ORGANISM="Hemiselmis andersenii, Strain CCMP441" /LENGTH=61 /DNA_ID=CAMNT_0012705035 /DNA_START=111 /DNA_END=296 /DNA_ORIENTATION=-
MGFFLITDDPFAPLLWLAPEEAATLVLVGRLRDAHCLSNIVRRVAALACTWSSGLLKAFAF